MRNFNRLLSLIVFVFLFQPFSAGAQSKTFTGYYLRDNKDTVRGIFPAFVDWNKNPSIVDFIPFGTNRTQILTVEDGNVFAVDDFAEYSPYKGKRLLNSITDREILSAGFEVEPTELYEDVSVFLRLVTRTTGAELFILRDAKRINFFFRRNGKELAELKFKKVYRSNKLTDIADFRQQLYNAFRSEIDEKGLLNRLEGLKYTEKELKAFFEVLYPATVLTKPLYRSEWSIGAGISVNMVGQSEFPSFSPIRKHHSISLSPLLFASVMVPVDRKFGRYFMNPQLRLFRYKNTTEYPENEFFTNSASYQASMVMNLQLAMGSNFINKDDFKLFGTVGAGAFIQFNGKRSRSIYRNSDGAITEKAPEMQLNALNYAMDASVGVFVNKKTSISTTYMLPISLQKIGADQTHMAGFQLKVGFRIK